MEKNDLKSFIKATILEVLEDGKFDLIDSILNGIQPTVDELIELYKEYSIKRLGKEMSDYDIEITTLSVKAGLMRSIEMYLKPTDKLKEMTSRSNKGNITINATIVRDGVEHYLSTDVIYAGGYNIQSRHLRYLTNTTLPKTGNQIETKKIEDKIKRLSKAEKLQKEIDEYNRNIERIKSLVDANKTKSRDDILDILRQGEFGRFVDQKWDDISLNSPLKQSGTTEEQWRKDQDKYIEDRVNSWIYLNIESKESSIVGYTKMRDKIQTKLNDIAHG